MPQLNQPLPLKMICLRFVALMVKYACNEIARIHANDCFHDRANVAIVHSEMLYVRNYCNHHIGHSFDDVCLEIFKFKYDTIATITDPRILVHIMFNKHSKIVPLLWNFQGMSMRSHTKFWASHLCILTNVKYLDISNILCSDLILKTISKNCKSLEILYFCSKSTYITIFGLTHLLNVPSMRVIQDNNNFVKFCNRDIRILLKYLPNLVAINYEHMGSLLCRTPQSEPLQLRHVYEKDLKVKHIDTIIKMCPDIECLRVGKSEHNNEDSFRALAASTMNVNKLEIVGPNGMAFQEVLPLLTAKGMYLTSLKIWRQDQWYIKDVTEIVLIGIACPFLKEFLFGMDIDTIQDIAVIPTKAYKMSKVEEQNIYRHLERLKIVGAMDFDCGIVDMCLKNATQITDLTLKPYGEQGLNMNTLLKKAMQTNDMNNLTTLSVYGPNVMMTSVASVEQLYRKLENLKTLSITAILSPDVVRCFQHVQSEIRMCNLDLDFTWRNLGDEVEDMEDADDSDEADSDTDMGGSDYEIDKGGRGNGNTGEVGYGVVQEIATEEEEPPNPTCHFPVSVLVYTVIGVLSAAISVYYY